MKYIIPLFIIAFFHIGVSQAQTREIGFNLECGILAKELSSSGFIPGMLSFAPFYNLNKNISIGGGLGYMVFDSVIDNKDIKSIPIFVYSRWKFIDANKFSPYVAARIGHGIISQNVSYSLPIFK